MVYLGGLWAVATPRLDLWTLLAAADLLALHLACTLASYGPPGLVLDRRLPRAVAPRATVCLRRGRAGLAGRPGAGFLDLPRDALVVGAALLVCSRGSAS